MASFRNRRVLLGLVSLLALCIALASLGGGLLNGQAHPGPSAATGTFAAHAPVDTRSTGILGDLDADGKVSPAERSDLSAAQAAVSTARRHLAAAQGLDTLLMTPAGDDWWHLVTGLSTQGALGNIPAPPGVDWYAYTEGRAYHPLSGIDEVYDAVHLVFTDTAALMAWVESPALSGLNGSSAVKIRGRVLTLVPVWVDPNREAFRAVDDKALAHVEVPEGIWTLNVSQWIDNRADESVLPEDYRQFWDHLGFARSGAVWSATSPSANAVWTGQVTGFDPARVDAVVAAGILNYSPAHCAPGADCNDRQGLSDAINVLWVADPLGGAGESMLKPALAPRDADVVIALTGDFWGNITGTTAKNYSPLGSLAIWVSDGSLMSLQPVVGVSGI